MERNSLRAWTAIVICLPHALVAQIDPAYVPPPLEAQAALRALMLQPQPPVSPPPRLESFGAVAPIAPTTTEDAGRWSISKRERDQQTWSSTLTKRDPITGREIQRVREFVEIGTGMNYQDEKGQWQSTQERFEATPEGGFVARFGPHYLALEQNINSLTAVQFIAADGAHLRSGPLAVGYYDPVDGRNVLLGSIRDTAGELTAPNEVTYRSAFDGIDASIRVTYRRGGMSADLILNELPPEPSDFGLSDLARLEMYTEFHPDTPVPVETTRLLTSEKDPATRQQMLEPDFTDTILDFGDYKMGTGTAFPLKDAADPSQIPVGKRLSIIDGRPILIEAVEWKAARPLTAGLPRSKSGVNSIQQASATTPKASGGRTGFQPVPPTVAQAFSLAMVSATVPVAGTSGGTASGTHAATFASGTLAPLPTALNASQAGSPSYVVARQLPPRSTPKPIRPVQEARASTISAEQRLGFVLDYSLVSGATNYIFESDKTYFVGSSVYLYGHTVFENAVIKYTNSTANPALRIKGTVEFKTSDYTPLICTSQNDNSIGQTLPWSTGNPWTSYYGNPALEFDAFTSGQVASNKHVRISHAATAMTFMTGTGFEVKHAQIVHCSTAFTPYYADVRLRNVLVHLADRVVSGSGTASATMRFEHLTASKANYLNYPSSSTTFLTNSLFVAVTNAGAYTGAKNASNTTFSAAFTTVGAGAHYLSGTAYRGLGTLSIQPQLLVDIRARTTQPPLVLTNGSIVVDTTLNPRAALRYSSTAAPDLGYHYPILDHVIGFVQVTNALLAINPGTAVGLTIANPGNYSLLLADGARLVVEGSPTNLARLIRSHLVQEQANNTWTAHGYSVVLPWWTASPVPEVSLRFAQVATVYDEFLIGYSLPATLSLRDSQIQGGATYNFSGSAVGITNCLFDRVYFSADLSVAPNATLRNNLFRGGIFEMFPDASTTVRDNLFDKTTIPYLDNVTSSHNGYVSGYNRLQPTSGTDKVMASVTYDSGTLGRYYLPAGSVLINAGSQSAATSGLYHYTTTTNQVMEAGTTVDIGLHFVATGTNGIPNDSDGDGLFDMAEDRNGNGTKDSTETDMLRADTDGDGLTDYQEVVLIGAAVTDPLVWDTNSNGINDANDDADGDLISNRGELDFGTKPLDAYSLNKASNGGSVNKDAVFLAVAASGGQAGDASARLGNPIITSTTVTLNLLDATPPFTYDIYRTTDFFVSWHRFFQGALNQTTFVVPNSAPSAFFQAGSAGDWDGDGLSDGYEVIVSKTCISAADTDGDGIPDSWELAYGLNPLSGTDASGDLDNDGISNLQEYLADVNAIRPTERLGPSSRRTPLVISEIMYHSAGGDALDYIELYNTHYATIDLSNYQLWFGDNPATRLVFTFPPNTILAANAFLLVVRNTSSYTAIPNRVGTFSRNLDDDSEQIRLLNAQGAVLLDVEYDDDAPWPLQADGADHSLVLARPSYGENDPRAWSASRLRGGSPGTGENSTVQLLDAIRINEFLANPAGGQTDFIELYNMSGKSVDISGCYLSDVSNNLFKFTIPVGTMIAPGGFKLYIKDQQNSFGFGLPGSGGAIFLTSPYLANAQSSRVLDAVRYFLQENGISAGRTPDGGREFSQLAAQSPGDPNGAELTRGAAASPGNIVINEIMFNPISDDDNDEYIELYNAGATAQSLQGWRISGVGFTFSTAFTLQPGTFVVVARNKLALAARYPAGQLTDGVNLVGNFTGLSGLANSGERIALINNSTGTGVVIDELTYVDGGRWGRWIDGGGASLELRDHHSDNRLASNWGDSSQKNGVTWTTVEFPGTLIQGYGASPVNALEIILLGAGECRVDNVEVIPDGGANKVSNGDFSSGSTGWSFEGNHEFSIWSASGGYGDNGGCLLLRASGSGDYLDNRVVSPIWSPALAALSTATIRARVGWLRGSTEIVLRLRGNWLEAPGTLSMPSNLGTPGLVNADAENAGPALMDVSHFPVLPQENEPILVSARVHDPNGLDSVNLRYRIDPSSDLESVTMKDDGTGGDRLAGDGLYSALIPGQSEGTLVAFHIDATDSLASSRFPYTEAVYPTDGNGRECLVRFGETLPTTSFGSYRFWITEATINRWKRYDDVSNPTGRPPGHNGNLDATFVYGGSRVVYGTGARYSGSVWTMTANPGYYSPVDADVICGYRLRFPGDDRLLGSDVVNLDRNRPGYVTAREQIGHWMAGRLGLPSTHRRFVLLDVNGQRRGTAYEDAEKPNGDYLEKWFPGADQGELFKIERAWTGIKGLEIGGHIDATLSNYERNGGKNLAWYRWTFEKERSQPGSHGNDYQSLFELVDAVAPIPINAEAVQGKMNVENWMRTIALGRASGNNDSYGFEASHNMYCYRRPGGLWELITYDFDNFASGIVVPSLLEGHPSAPEIGRMLAHPLFLRAYLRGLKDASTGPLQASAYDAFINQARQAILDNGITTGADDAVQVREYLAGRRDAIEALLPSATAFSITTGNGTSVTIPASQNQLTLTGVAPLEVVTIGKSGANATAGTLVWPTTTGWNLPLTLAPAVSPITVTVQGYDRFGQPLQPAAAYTKTITITRQ